MDKKLENYEQPTITDHGDLTELTAGQHTPLTKLDATYVSGTYKSQLTWSNP